MVCTRSENLSWAELRSLNIQPLAGRERPRAARLLQRRGHDESTIPSFAPSPAELFDRGRRASFRRSAEGRKSSAYGRNRRTRARTGRWPFLLSYLLPRSSPQPNSALFSSPIAHPFSLARDYPSGNCRRIEQHGRQEGRAVLHAAAEARKMGGLPGLHLELRDGAVSRAHRRQLG